MSSDQAKRVGLVAAALVPPLTDRLGRHQLAEIEVQQGDVRVRVSRGAAVNRPVPAPAATAAAPSARPASDAGPAIDANVLRSPAVGYFLAAEGLSEGMAVGPGTGVGQVEMLGITHDVRAAGPGIVRRVTVENGQAVEYGQPLVEIGQVSE